MVNTQTLSVYLVRKVLDNLVMSSNDQYVRLVYQIRAEEIERRLTENVPPVHGAEGLLRRPPLPGTADYMHKKNKNMISALLPRPPAPL
jgi:hypothetical protein